jgi:hypothetical protein
MQNAKRKILSLTIMLLSLGCFIQQGDLSAQEWKSWDALFNGKNLAGFKVPAGDNGHWKVLDGVIDYDAQSEAAGKDKNLWTQDSFGNFKLHLEWRLTQVSGLYPMKIILPDGSYKKDAFGKDVLVPSPNADSGLLLRGPSSGQQVQMWCWPVGSGELWNVRNNKSLTPAQRAAAVPKVKADKPVGEWNVFDITLVGDRVTVVLNGHLVIDNAQIPGLPERGPLGFQHHGGIDKKTGKHGKASSTVQFRNIRIKSL